MSTDIETRLRAMLLEQARHAPDGVGLAERIVAEATAPARVVPLRRRGGWRTWTLPLIAAGAVAAVVGAVVGLENERYAAPHRAPAGGSDAPVTSPAPVVPGPTSAATPAPQASSSPVAAPQPVPAAFRVTDLTFVSQDEGWALGGGQCFADPSSRCTAMLHTTDGGLTWTSVKNPPVNVPDASGACADPCARHLRFADDRVAYAYGPSALFLTTDGGATWTRQPGGADQIEVIDGVALRLAPTAGSSCVSPCGLLERSTAGTATWRPVTVPGGGDGTVRQLQVVPGFAAALAGNGDVITSTDDGATWTDSGTMLPQVLTTAVGIDRSLALVTAPTQPGGPPDEVHVSTDGGRSFGPPRTIEPAGAYASGLAVAGSGTLLAARDEPGSAPVLVRSTDGGVTWTRVATGEAGGGAEPGAVTVDFLGFESDRVGRWVPGDGSTIWTTTDAGVSWSQHHFA